MMVKTVRNVLVGLFMTGLFAVNVSAESCTDKLFSVTMNSETTIGDAVDNLAETCGLTVIVKDAGAQYRLKKKLYYMKLRNASLRSFLDTLLKDNDLSYSLRGNKLSISYLVTRTFKVHYVTGKRTGSSNSNVQVAGGATSGEATSISGSSINITTDQEFHFWSTIQQQIHRILNTAGDGSIHYTKFCPSTSQIMNQLKPDMPTFDKNKAEGKECYWIGPDGQKWEYNPLDPVIDPEAGMVTVTGTARQIERVSRYIATLIHQLKTQVMIDVRIIDVRIDNSKTYGIDWNKIYSTSIGLNGQYGFGVGSDTTKGGGSFTATFSGDLTEVLKFLKTQGDVTIVSSPRVMTLNNQPAMITVGKEIYYKLTTTNKVGGSDTATSQGEVVKSVFAGILLDITPEVDERGMITLKVNPSITSLADGGTDENLQGTRTMPPDMKRRQIAAVIKVKDGNHAILGGLITRSKGTQESGVPVLSKIPVLGYAFKRENVLDVTDELVLIITPHIIRDNKNLTLKDLGYSRLR